MSQASQLSKQGLFKQDLIYLESVTTSEELFQSVGSKLLQKGLVNKGYMEAITERERNFPTGLDLSVVGADVPNVAIPHTEVEYCNWKGVVVVKLQNEILFCNMIAPDKKLTVKYAFFILNNEKDCQTNILSNLMAFFTQGQTIKDLDKLTAAGEIYQYLISKY